MPGLSLGTGVGFRGRRPGGPPPAEPPRLLAAPRLVGSGRIGAPLAVDPGVWRGTPAPVLGLRWLRDGAPIAGAGGAGYLPGAADDRAAIACEVVAANAAGTAAALTPPVVVTHVPPALAAPLPDIVLVQNTGIHSMTLSTAFTGLALSFGVTGNGVSIDPATGEIRIPTDALQDGLEVAVTASNSGGDAVGSFRLTVRAAEPAATPPLLVTPPSLAGSGVIGSPLTVDPGRWDGRPTPELTLQWRRDGADIAGAVAASYLPSADDDGAELGCAVTARNPAGELEAVAGPLRATRPAPVVAGTLPDLLLEAGTGVRAVEAAAAFAGEALRFTASGAGASVDPLTGVVAIPTDAELAEAPVTVTASNSGGSATTGFRVTVAAAIAAPEAVGGIPDLVLEQGAGAWTVSAQAAFRGEALAFALEAAPAGVGIDPGTGLVTIATDGALAAAPVTVRASNAAGAATQSFAVTVRSTVTAFDAAGRLGELGFIADVAPSWSQEAGFARLVPSGWSGVVGDWSKALGDGRYRCLARWGGATTPQTVNRPFWFSARFRRIDGNCFGVRADLFEKANGERLLQLQQYTGAGTTTAVIAAAAVVGWAWDAWQWVELEIDGTAVRARVYPEGGAAPDWQIAGTTDQTAPGAFGPGGQPGGGRSPVIDLRRLEVHPLAVHIPAIPAAPLDSDWDIAQFTERT
jgi:hypothetical protein